MRSFFLLLPIGLLLSCGTDDEQPAFPELAIDLVTGLELTDENGQPLANLGNPNIWNEDVEIFPNPAADVLAIHAQENIDTIWLLPGEAQKTYAFVNYDSLLQEYVYSPEDIKTFPVQQFTPGASQFFLNLESLPAGYYRLFFKRPDGTINWHNLYFNPEQTLSESRNALSDFWD